MLVINYTILWHPSTHVDALACLNNANIWPCSDLDLDPDPQNPKQFIWPWDLCKIWSNSFYPFRSYRANRTHARMHGHIYGQTTRKHASTALLRLLQGGAKKVEHRYLLNAGFVFVDHWNRGVIAAAMLNIFLLAVWLLSTCYICSAYVCDVYNITNKTEMFYFILPHPVLRLYRQQRHKNTMQ